MYSARPIRAVIRKGTFFATAFLICAVLNFMAGGPAFANELWLAPEKQSQDKKVGNWAVANLGGETHFSFRIPENLQTFTEAAVVLIPPRDGALTYDLHLNRTTNLMPHTANPVDLLNNVTPFLNAGVLTEIDVTSAFAGVAAQDYVSLNLQLTEKLATTQVVGLRFKYEATSGDIMGVNAGTGLTGGGSSGDVTLSFDTAFGDGRYVTLFGAQTITGAKTFTNVGNSFTGNGVGLTNLNASNLVTGTLPSGRLSGVYSNALNFNNPSNFFAGTQATLNTLCLGVDCRTSWPVSGIGGSGTAGFVASFTSPNTLGNSILFTDPVNLRVGVGTTSPGATLHLTKAGNHGILLANTVPNPDSGVGLFAVSDVSGTYGRITSFDPYPLRFTVGNADRIVIEGNGDVGIGTTNPTDKLHVVGNVRAEGSVQVGLTADACTASGAGRMRFNSATQAMEFCNGTQWKTIATSP